MSKKPPHKLRLIVAERSACFATATIRSGRGHHNTNLATTKKPKGITIKKEDLCVSTIQEAYFSRIQLRLSYILKRIQTTDTETLFSDDREKI